jgi:hypothetical protein
MIFGLRIAHGRLDAFEGCWGGKPRLMYNWATLASASRSVLISARARAILVGCHGALRGAHAQRRMRCVNEFV